MKKKYSLVNHLLQEMHLTPQETKLLANQIISNKGQGKKVGNAGETFIEKHLKGQNLNLVKNNFPFADVFVGDVNDLARSDTAAHPGLVFYSVKAAARPGLIDIKQDLNPNDFCHQMVRKKIIPPSQTSVFIRWGVYMLTTQGKGGGMDAVVIRKFGPITVQMEKINNGSKTSPSDWICVYAGKRPGRSRDTASQVDMKSGIPNWSGDVTIRGIQKLESAMGVTHKIVAESDPFPVSEKRLGRRDPAGRDAHDAGVPGEVTNAPGFKGI